jgi:uncharacterized ion transporter superfamily protein YfcC
VAVTFLAAGIAATLVSGMSGKELGKTFWQGLVSICPAVLMILMASSIKYTLEEARVLDTLLHGAVELAQTMPRWTVILFIYAMVLVMNFFIPSGSAKAFMLIPLIVPMAQLFGISRQLCVVAFAFGDGFSNVFYPTNPALLISSRFSQSSMTGLPGYALTSSLISVPNCLAFLESNLESNLPSNRTINSSLSI